MNPWVLIVLGGLLILAGTIIGGYGWHLLPSDNSKIESKIIESEQRIQNTLDQKIHAINDQLIIQTNINDPRMQDAGKISATIHWKNGPIIDVGNPKDITKNRLQAAIKYPDQIYLYLYDSNGEKYVLQSEFNHIDKMVMLECLWSSKMNVIAILANNKILSKVQIPGLMLFHDTSVEREIRIGSNFEGEGGLGNIKEVKIFASKAL